MVKMEKFSEFITEEKDEPYKLIVFQNSNDVIRDVKDSALGELTELLKKAAQSSGIEIYFVDFTGLYVSKKNNKQYINSFPFDDNGYVQLPDPKDQGSPSYQGPIEIDPENTLIMPRGLGRVGMSNNPTWTDIIKDFELQKFLTIPSIKNWTICSSKYLTDIYCRKIGLNTPKTIPITYSEDTERAFKELNTKFPIILKSSTGTQTGVGVIIAESMRSLNAFVQMLKLYEKHMPIIIQEFIKTDYDVRVVVLDGKVLGAMKREIISDGDFRSNVSLGAESFNFELTEIEEKDSIAAAKSVFGRLVGIDFIPAKNREKDQPYILEVNAMPGFGGIEKIKKGLTKQILNHFKNRDNWNLDKSTET
jgi:ribosomal protein S6--L-glutamate ligase